MSGIVNVSRRGFLKGMVSAGALVISVRMFPETLWTATAEPGYAGTHVDRAALRSSVYVGIETDGTVYIVAHRSEMGTGIRTSLPLVLADELDADWKRVKVEQAIGDARYGSQDTDGSHSIRQFYDAMREAGATARLMLTQAAAQKWNVPVTDCECDLHSVVHRGSERRADYGQLTLLAAKLKVPDAKELQFKPPSAWRYVGKGMVSYDLEGSLVLHLRP